MGEREHEPRKRVLGDWSFYAIRLEDKEMFNELTKECEYPAHLWSANFAYLWADSQSSDKKVLWRFVDGMLVPFVLMRRSGLHLACLPFGKGRPDQVLYTVYKCLKFCNHWNRYYGFSPGTVRTMNQDQFSFLKKTEKFDQYFEYMKLKGLERHFGIQNLVQLTGKDFSRIRNQINKFNRENPTAMVRRYRPEDFEPIMKINEEWKQKAQDHYTEIFDDVYFPQILKQHEALAHIIFVIEVDGQIVGMVSGGLTPAGQSWGCLAKRMVDIKGLNEYMMVEFAREIHRINPAVEHLNVGSDLGVSGLVAFKEKFRPVLSLERYRIRLK